MSQFKTLLVEVTEEAEKCIGNNAIKIDAIDGKLVVFPTKDPNATPLKSIDSAEDNPFRQNCKKYKTLMSAKEWEGLIDEDNQ